ncbi:MAG: hypothetical protein IT555_00165, partial [Acetobacteraceae bacterium]|nr:hypothetical protein [Acetobacteraceae bacterium]
AFTPTARVDTAGLVASTIGIANGDFMAGRMNFDQPGRPGAAVVNEGEITVRDGGLAALVAPEVRNSGTIRARLGRVALAGAESFVLDPRGDGLISFEVSREGPARQTRAENTGRIEAAGGSVTISAASARGIVAGVVNIEGQVVASSVGQANGVVSFGGGENGTTTVAGNVDVRGTGAGERGGRVAVTGDRVRVTSSARIDASGAAGGGSVKIGGDRQGRGTTQRARATDVERGAVIRADATQGGNGGEVIVWSDEYTRFMGTISARGGTAGGNGGFAEVSGRRWLGFDGTVDLRAPRGLTGTLLLDPTDITISALANNDITAASPFEFIDNTAPPSTSGTSNLNVTTLQTALAAGNVVVSTAAGAGAPDGGTITVADAVAWSSGNTLDLQASTGVAVNAALTATADGTPGGLLNGSVVMSVSGAGGIGQSAAGVITASSVTATTANGAVTLDNAANRVGTITGSAAGSGGAFSFVNAGALTAQVVTASNNLSLRAGGNLTQSGTLTAGSGATLTLEAAGQLAINGQLAVDGGTAVFAADTITGAATNGTGFNVGGTLTNTPATSVFRTATAGRSIGFGDGTAGDLALANTQIANLAPASGGTIRVGSRGAAVHAGEVATGALAVGNMTLGSRALALEAGSAGAGISQLAGGGIGATGITAQAAAGSVVLANINNQAATISGSAAGAGNDFTYANFVGVEVRGISAADTVSLTAGGNVTQGAGAANAISATTLAVVGGGAAGTVTLDNTANNVANLSGRGQGGFTYADASGFAVAGPGLADPGINQGGGVIAGPVSLRAASGTITQSAPLAATSLAATANAGSVQLTGTNTVASISGSALGAGNDFAFTNGTGFAVAGITAADQASLSAAAGDITQTGAIDAARLSAIASAGNVMLGSTANSAGTVAGSAAGAGNDFTFGNGAGFVVAGITAADAVTLTADAGAITQSAAITGAALSANATTGTVTLEHAANAFASVSGAAGGGAFSIRTGSALAIGGSGITASGDASVLSGGNLTVSQPVSAGSGALLRLQAPGGSALAINAALAAPGGTAELVADTIIGLSGTDGFGGGSRPATTIVRSATAGRSIGFGTSAVGDLALSGPQIDNLAPTSAGTFRVGSVNRAGEAAAGAIEVRDVNLGTRTLVLESAAAGTAINQVGTLVATGGLATIAPNGNVVLGGTNSFATISIDTNGAFSLTNTIGFEVRGIRASSVALTAQTGDITQATGAANRIQTGGLTVTATAGSVTLDNAANAVATVQGAAGNGDFAFTNATALTVNGVAATGSVALAAGGDLTVPPTSQVTAGAGQRLMLQAGGELFLNHGFFLQPSPLSVANGTAVFVADRITVTNFGFGSLLAGPVQQAEIRTATTGRDIVVGAGNPATELVLDSATLAQLAPLSGGGTLRVGATGVVVGEAGAGRVQVNDPISQAGGTVILESGSASATAISQAQQIIAGGLAALAPAGGVVLTNPANSIGNEVAGQAGAGGFAFTNNGNVVVGTAGGTAGIIATGGTVTLAATGFAGVSQTAPIVGTALVASGFGSVALANPANQVGSVGGSSSFGNFTFTGGGGYAVSGISAPFGTVTLASPGGGITQTGAIAANVLEVTAAGTIGLDTVLNQVATLRATATAPASDVRFQDSGTLAVTGITAPGAVVLTAGSGITQGAPASAAISAASLQADGGAGAVALTNASNAVGTVSGSGAGFTYVDVDALVTGPISSTGAVTLSAGGLLSINGLLNAAGQSVALSGVGIGQTAAITAGSLVANGGAGAVVLTNAANAVGTVSGGGAGFAYADIDALATGPISSTGAVALSAGGLLSINGLLDAPGQSVALSGIGIDQSAPISAGSLVANGGAGAVALTNAGNAA